MNHQSQVLRLQPYEELKIGNKEFQKVIRLEAGLSLRRPQKLLRICSKKMRLKIKILIYKMNSLDQFAK